jgi:hypothetical protein
MEELAYLGDQPHLPLSESTSLAEAIALCNQFYQTNLNPEDYLQTQACMTPTGKLQIDVIPVKDGVQSDVVITFVNKAFSFVNELKAFDKKYIEKDPSYGKILSGKIVNNSRPRMYMSFGVESGFDNTGKDSTF